MPESGLNIVDDIFEGWLSMPSIGNFLGGDFWETSDVDKNRENQSQLSPQAPEDPAAGSPIARKRKGHTKSRLGCISCKGRKIKCQEQWPSCTNCIKRGCPCRYVTVFKHTQHDRIVSEAVSNPRQVIRLTDTPTTYSANDLRLFHHFLVAAHPYSPHGHDAVWVRDIPALSHQYDYLMHSILALAGSHLSIFVNDPRGNMALSHRQKAITGLEEAFTRWPRKAEEAHVMLASSYILAFQSAYLPDGIVDNIISLRGCALISQMIQDSHMEGIFSLEPRLHYLESELKLRNFPALDQGLARDALRSLAGFAHLLCEGREIERAFFAQLVESVRPLLVPSRRSSPQISTTPDPTNGRSEETVSSSENSPFSAPSPTIRPLFPGGLAASYDNTLSGTAKDIVDVPTNYKVEPRRAFNALISGRIILCTWPQGDVLHLFSPANRLGAVLIAHYFAIRFIVSPLWALDPAMKTPIKGMIEWCEKVVDSVEDDEQVKWMKYVEWPSHILRTMRCCINQKKGLTFGDLYDILIKDPGAFREGSLRRL